MIDHMLQVAVSYTYMTCTMQLLFECNIKLH